MLTRQQFNAAIYSWALSAGFTCEIAGQPRSFFDLAVVKNKTNSELTLLTISIESWEKSAAPDFDTMQRLVAELRAGGQQCVVLWEDFWIRNPALVQSRLSAILQQSFKIPARLTQARRIDQQAATNFLSKNHLNGPTAAKFKFGLFLPQRYFRVLQNTDSLDLKQSELLVAVATFSYPRIFQREGNPHKSYELIRFASLANTNVVGGLDKLLRAFEREREPDDIMTYADLDWSVGKSYERLGFQQQSFSAPESFLLNLQTFERMQVARVPDPDFPSVVVKNLGNAKFVKTFSRR